jgi:hypothetical protein
MTGTKQQVSMTIKLLIVLLLFSNGAVNAQDSLQVILADDLYANDNELINGRKWTYEKKYSGSPLLFTDDWPLSDLNYNKRTYRRQFVNFDLVTNRLILSSTIYGQVRFIILSNEDFSGFSFTDPETGNDHQYEYLSLSGAGEKQLFENCSQGSIRLYIRPVKRLEISAGTSSRGTYTGSFEYFLSENNDFKKITSKKQLLLFLGKKTAELNRFIRKYNLKINEKNPDAVIEVLKYYSTLK